MRVARNLRCTSTRGVGDGATNTATRFTPPQRKEKDGMKFRVEIMREARKMLSILYSNPGLTAFLSMVMLAALIAWRG